MCSHYQTLKDAELLLQKFGVRSKPAAIGKYDMWPRYEGVFVRRPPEHDAGDDAVPEREAAAGRWGLISAMTRSGGLERASKLSTFNARAETAAGSYTFGNAWRRAQHCIIPADAIFEPDWTSGKAVATRFTRADGKPLGIAGLWDRYRDAAGHWQESYTMLTINADNDPVFSRYHQPNTEKRMVVILPEGAYGDWLTASAAHSREMLVPFPADMLTATPMARPVLSGTQQGPDDRNLQVPDDLLNR
ncbi:SOS response-associated peptidase [Achromobacter animicus]|uniref:SOS response-associated peptidase n=1 Tax=Achromobacter animicus TaxID=1389935 RepID=UPI0028A8FC91|nr:SOS response-associated peptidase family protein [Achromobacter animicus]